jgi:Eukaryotic translation initiation factor 3 subunit 8 N-terminus
MSKFWAEGGASSDSDDDDDASSSGDDSENSSDDSSEDDDSASNENGGGLGQTGQQEANRWLAMSDDSSDEDSVRVVMSGKERFQETITNLITSIRKAMKVRDYYEIQTLFENLSKALIKNKQYLVSGVPRPLVRLLCDLEDYAVERLADKEQFKTLSARQGRALNRFKLTFKKHNRQYQTVMTAYRANPDRGEDEDEDDGPERKEDKADDSSSDSSSSSSSSSSDSDSSDDDSDDDAKAKTKGKATGTKKKKDDDDSVRLSRKYCTLPLVFVTNAASFVALFFS